MNGGLRAAALGRLADERFDLLIVGGGATGAAIARDAAWRGLRVALCERGDFAGETSSYSSKLIHGGLRYLEHADLALVFEALADRNRLMRAAPHLCRPVDFLIPGYRGERPSLTKVALGVALYNALALYRPPARGERLSPSELLKRAPLLRRPGLEGAQVYVDCQTDDARLVLEHVLDAELAGAVCVPYVEVGDLVRGPTGHVRGARVRDREAGGELFVQASVVVMAVGPFADAMGLGPRRLRPTLGVHAIVPSDRLATGGRAFLLRAPQDGRVFFVLPSGPRTTIGTTDTDWRPPDGADRAPRAGDCIEARAADVSYLLRAANHAFPGADLTADDVLSTFAGLRPLVASSVDDPSATSREHALWADHRGTLVMAGGKLTTMRSMGEHAVDRAIELLRARGHDAAVGACVTRTRPLPGGAASPTPTPGLDRAVFDRLASTYGCRADEVGRMALACSGGTDRMVPDLPCIWAEVPFAARHERATDLEDVLRRRLPVFRLALDQGLSVAPRAAVLMGAELGWSARRCDEAVARYRARVQATRAWRG